MKKQGSGWKGESRRHSLARKGIITGIKPITDSEYTIKDGLRQYAWDNMDLLRYYERTNQLDKLHPVIQEEWKKIKHYEEYEPIEPFAITDGFNNAKGKVIGIYHRPPRNWAESQGEIDYSMHLYQVQWDDGAIQYDVVPESIDRLGA